MKKFILLIILFIGILLFLSKDAQASHCVVSGVNLVQGSSLDENGITKTNYTLQAQDVSGESCHTNQTLRFSLETTGSGVFTSPSGGSLTYSIASSTANRNFMYAYNIGEGHTITVSAGYGEINSWEILFTDSINVASIEPPEDEPSFTPYYVVDEKPQVLFGDSAQVDGYQGLENYSYDYVDGYAHITFTYTHASCCYASFPPQVLVTDVDPTATNTPTVKYKDVAYYLMVGSAMEPPHITGWYLYDIQFNNQGYTINVKRDGVTEMANETRVISGFADTDWAALMNAYPSAPGYPTVSSMSFTPIPVKQAGGPVEEEPDPEEPPTVSKIPVIIIPGIMGSYLNKDDGSDEEIWMNIQKMILPGRDLYLDSLLMLENGSSTQPITASDIIKEVGEHKFFTDLIDTFEGLGYVFGNNLFVFPYDWRTDIALLSEKLDQNIREVLSNTGSNSVDVIAHSMGGLITKKYLLGFGGNSVRVFVDIGTPHNGSPKAFKILNFGDSFGFEKFGFNLLNQERIKIISQNMPSVYQLLPSRKYFNDLDNNYKYYVWNGLSGNNRLTFDETKTYLGDSGRNTDLLDRADLFHQEIDDLNPADYGVEAYNIVGCGVPTLGQVYILDKKGDHYNYNIKMINGDGTVPLRSAEAMPALKTYYVKGAQHATMPSSLGVKELVTGVLENGSGFDISPYSNLSMTSEGCTIPNGKLISFHSPVDLHIYDSFGNHAGLNSDGDLENNIDKLVYEIIEDNKFAFIPDGGGSYLIQGSSTGAGSLSIRLATINNGEVANTELFDEIAITPETKINMELNGITEAEASVDIDGNGTEDSVIQISDTVSGFLERLVDPKPQVIADIPSSSGVVSSRQGITKIMEFFEESNTAPVVNKSTTVTKPNSLLSELKELHEQSKNKPKDNRFATTYFLVGGAVKSFFAGLWEWFISKI